MPQRRQAGAHCRTLSGILLRLFFCDRIDDQVAAVAGTFAHGADASGTIQFEMNDAAVARRHGIESKRLTRFTDALRGHARGELEFLETRRTVVAAIEADAVVQRWLELQPAVCEMLEREQEFTVTREKNIFVRPAEPDHKAGGRSGAIHLGRTGIRIIASA